MTSDVDKIAAARRAVLQQRLQVSRKQLTNAEHWAQTNQASVFPGVMVGSQYDQSPTILGATGYDDKNPNEQRGFQVTVGQAYDKRDPDEQAVVASKLLAQIMPIDQARKFAEGLQKEISSAGAAPVFLYVLIDSWPTVKAAILQNFRTKTDISTLYCWVLQYLQKRFADSDNNFNPDRSMIDSTEDVQKAAQAAQAVVLAQQQASDSATVMTGYQQAQSTQAEAITAEALADRDFENRLSQNDLARFRRPVYTLGPTPATEPLRVALINALESMDDRWEPTDPKATAPFLKFIVVSTSFWGRLNSRSRGRCIYDNTTTDEGTAQVKYPKSGIGRDIEQTKGVSCHRFRNKGWMPG